MNRPVPQASTLLRWDEEHIKNLLTEPETLLEEEAFSEWVRQQGGLQNVYNLLRGLPLSEKQRKTLKAILDKPGASLQEYSLMLHVSVATFVRYRASLLRSLAAVLNARLLERQSAEGEGKTNLAYPTNLPAAFLPFIGREEELQTVRFLLLRDEVRLLTITGPGGIGKTRLALQAASDLLPHFRDGVFLVSLGVLTEPDLVASTIAQTLHIKGEDHVGYEILKEHLRNKQLLLVLDNFEQVAEAAPLLNRLLNDAPGLKIVVTSRSVLHLYGEFEFNVPPLAIPNLAHLPPTEALAQIPSVALFLTRARMVQSDFQLTDENARAIAEICVRLEGIPLAIELAAARVKLFSPAALLRELNNTLSVLSDRNVDVLPRHQSMRDTIEWSYRLLNAEEQSLYAHLGVFAGSFTMEAAQAIWFTGNRVATTAIIELLASLIDKSMLQRQSSPNGEPRFSLLEVLREYALERLRASGQEESARRRHLQYYRDFVERLEASGGASITPEWLRQLEIEHDNLRAALRWAMDTADYESALRIAGAIWRFWQVHGHVEEGQRWLNAILESAPAEISLARCKALWGAGWLGMVSGSLDVARLRFEEGVDVARHLGEQRFYGLCLLGVGAVERALGAFDQAQNAFEECLAVFQKLEDWENVAWVWEHLGVNALESGNFEQAVFYFLRSLEAFQRLGQPWACAEALMFLGHTALQRKEYQQAQDFYQRALTLYETLNDPTQRVSMQLYLGAALFGQGKRAEAIALYRENLARAHDLKDYWGLAWGVERAAEVAEQAGHLERAARLWGAANALRSFSGMLWPPGFRSTYTEQRFLNLEAQLGSERWQQLWEEGNRLSLNDAVAEALTALS